MSAGRPTDYTPALVEKICLRVALGENLNVICADESMPSQPTVYAWLDKHEEFLKKYETARTKRADARSDRIDGISRKVEDGKIEPNAAAVILKAEMWQAGRENPKKYGDKVNVEATGKDGAPLVPPAVNIYLPSNGRD
jgi:hypothetical protein